MNTLEFPDGSAASDGRVLEAALHLAGLTDRFELAETLGWSLTRLERALEHLRTRLHGGAVRLVYLGREVQLAVLETAVPVDSLARLTQRGQMRTELSAAEAARILRLITGRLTNPSTDEIAETTTAQDAELLERGVVVHDVTGPGAESGIAVHPDVYFALGLCPFPVAAAVPQRPDPPSAAR